MDEEGVREAPVRKAGLLVLHLGQIFRQCRHHSLDFPVPRPTLQVIIVLCPQPLLLAQPQVHIKESFHQIPCPDRSQDVTPSPAGVHRIFSPATRLSLMNSRTPVPETSDFRVPRDSLKTSPTPSHPAPATTLERTDLTGACLRSLRMRHQDEKVEEGVFHVQELGAEKEIITTATRAHLPSSPLGIQTLDLRAGSQGQHESGAVRGHRLGQRSPSRGRGGCFKPDWVPRSCSGPAA